MKKLSVQKLETIKGGQGQGGVPFTILFNQGCGPLLPNLNGYAASAAALVNAGVFGAPLIVNLGTNNGLVCPG